MGAQAAFERWASNLGLPALLERLAARRLASGCRPPEARRCGVTVPAPEQRRTAMPLPGCASLRPWSVSARAHRGTRSVREHARARSSDARQRLQRTNDLIQVYESHFTRINQQ